ncbi:hypothetical protein F511_08874 [Dorcoceras hygrometricum]|uniref:Uncharacterized protein n=1 Tax=Dorcoceras hygrometricum TaxID=472368 RepID=A0A2Z7CAW6_9LAMI|nr:hypothetical protein F511_08874 [Dorcoceras hygrometricum]
MVTSSSLGYVCHGKSISLNKIPRLVNNLNFDDDLDVEEEEFMAIDDPTMGEEMPFMGKVQCRTEYCSSSTANRISTEADGCELVASNQEQIKRTLKHPRGSQTLGCHRGGRSQASTHNQRRDQLRATSSEASWGTKTAQRPAETNQLDAELVYYAQDGTVQYSTVTPKPMGANGI